eukprot:1190075-Rhodomonas_salina.2
MGFDRPLSSADVETVMCAKSAAGDYCVQTVPSQLMESDPSIAALDTLCGSACTDTWVYWMVVGDEGEAPTEGRRRTGEGEERMVPARRMEVKERERERRRRRERKGRKGWKGGEGGRGRGSCCWGSGEREGGEPLSCAAQC